MKHAGSWYYYLADGLGSTMAVVDSAGAVQKSYDVYVRAELRMEVSQGTTVITVHCNAYHSMVPVENVTKVLGHGELELSVGDYHSDGSSSPRSIWVREIASETCNEPLAEAASWLDDNHHSLKQLCSDGWELRIDVTIVARDPMSSIELPRALLQEVSRHECLSLALSVFPKPNLMP